MESNVSIREAISEDLEFISGLMVATLNQYYSEDHQDKAQKILNAHTNKEDKNFGLLTFEQKVFIVLLGEEKIGLVDLVMKRQNTFKISPIIIKPEYRNKGYGSKLYQHIEEYVKSRNGRQIFCTVSEESKRTINFFYKQKFIVASECLDYQKDGVIEYLLYKDFQFTNELQSHDNYNISLAEEVDFDNIKKALVDYFSKYISVIDEKLFEKLFRITNNQRKNEVFIAAKINSEIVGLAVASKKKSGIIKVLPIIHTNNQVFFQIINFLPLNFSNKGFRKIYLQTFTDPFNVMSLQNNKWELEGILPKSYNQDSLTLLWTKKLT